MDTLLPILEPGSWPQRDELICRPLIEGLPGADTPLVALCQQREPLLVYLGPERLAWLGVDAAEAEARAVANLQRLPALWRQVQAPTPRGGWLELHVNEEPLAAERILDRAELHRLSRERLGDDGVALGIPHRGLLLACTAAAALEGAFGSVVRGLYEDAVASGGPALSPRVYLAEQGELVGVLT